MAVTPRSAGFGSFRGKLIAAFLGCTLIPGLAVILIYGTVFERASDGQRTGELERTGFLLREAARAVDQFANLAQRDLGFFATGAHPAIDRWRSNPTSSFRR